MAAPYVVGTSRFTRSSAGIAVHLRDGLPQYLAWSPTGNHIALITAKEGAWLLDVARFEVEPVVPATRQFWVRPVWNETGDQLLLSAAEQLWWLRRTKDGWAEQKRVAVPGVTRWVEWMTPLGCAGICLPSDGSSTRILRIDQNLSITAIMPRLPSGEPLSVFASEFPTWWMPGESLLILGYAGNALKPYIVHLDTGEAQLWDWSEDKGLGYLHCYSRAFQVPVVAGLLSRNPSLLFSETADERVAGYDIELQASFTFGEVSRFPYHSPISISPDGGRIAFIDREYALHILPLKQIRTTPRI
jgi:hypothetical protein